MTVRLFSFFLFLSNRVLRFKRNRDEAPFGFHRVLGFKY